MRLLLARVIDKAITTPCRSAQAASSNPYSFRTIPNWIASGKIRYHSARQLASTRWVPANTQK
ncbi:hypothetical protein V1294_000493 [Bradyrhizobium sp. AZCC 1678]|uniref:hypothetical protein n=1 Tax=Bradyrhizobium sp. AZCC 1678 TaxID=3117030 RepID=UPI002FF19F83